MHTELFFPRVNLAFFSTWYKCVFSHLLQSCRGTSQPRAVRSTQTGFRKKPTCHPGRKYSHCLWVRVKHVNESMKIAAIAFDVLVMCVDFELNIICSIILQMMDRSFTETVAFCSGLLSKFLLADPDSRITIAEIKADRWFTQGKRQLLSNGSCFAFNVVVLIHVSVQTFRCKANASWIRKQVS